MGHFSGVLLVSDLDGTLLDDQGIVTHDTNTALRAFVREGGSFTAATGRALGAFLTVRGELPLTHPVILGGGSLLYDCATGRVLEEVPMPDGLAAAQAIAGTFPDLGIECHRADGIWCYRAQESNRAHLAYVGVDGGFVDRLEDIPQPWLKLVFCGRRSALHDLRDWLERTGYLEGYGAEFSCETLLEFHAAEATKGNCVARLAQRHGFAHIFCAGDNDNDLSMLTRFTGLVPGNAHATIRRYSAAALPGNDNGFVPAAVAWIADEIGRRSKNP